MNPPTATTRFIGRPRVAAVLQIGGGLTLLGWMHGAVPWWLGIMALCFIGTVRNAVREVRRYDAWFAEWQVMGGYDAPATGKAKPPASRGKLAARAVGFALSVWAFSKLMPAGQEPPVIYIVLWFLMVGGCLWTCCRLIASFRRNGTVRRAASNKAMAKARNADDVVEWVLPPASASPSRSDVTRKLPDYAARLLG